MSGKVRLETGDHVSSNRRFLILFLSLLTLQAGFVGNLSAQQIPLPEHPRPDFQRSDWINLNGPWSFAFDGDKNGEQRGWSTGQKTFEQTITVPFPWGSKLSGVKNQADVGWYLKKISVPATWKGKRVFLVVGASDWLSTAWLDGKEIGKFQGGYTPFEFEMTPHLRFGEEQNLVLRVDDSPHPFKLEGKQGYGPARGIWQTVYLEARPDTFIRSVRFTPDIDKGLVSVQAEFNAEAPSDMELRVNFKTGQVTPAVVPVKKGAKEGRFDVPIPNARLWSLDDPFLYEVQASLSRPGTQPDVVETYFGMRKIGVVKLPGSGFTYIALNNKPIYLQLTLDQSYHPDGFYTFPSDEFMRDEILRTRRIGLNGQRLHVKIDVPRKLYWADRLGVLLMADVPNSWGEPGAEMRAEAETALRGLIARDFNHPSIFSWVIFNETWGLQQKDQKRTYLPETQEWVASMFKLAKSLDSSRLVEDNSPCNHDHVVTDINSWHVYLPGYAWREHLTKVTTDTFPGSKWNFIGGRTQGEQPLLNSECGNVWGYEGSTGDVDWSWDYHIMMNEFRRQPKVCGWLYTEHHDVINEWNGYYRFDRSDKLDGMSALVPGMTLKDLHSPYYIVPETPLCSSVAPGSEISIPLRTSFMTEGKGPGALRLRAEVWGYDDLGQRQNYSVQTVPVPFGPWSSKEIAPIKVRMPDAHVVVVVGLTLEEGAGAVLHRNFLTFLVGEAGSRDEERLVEGRRTRLLRLLPGDLSGSKWSERTWKVFEGLKVNGAGYGYFEYSVAWPKGLKASDIEQASFRAELSAKKLNGKDRQDSGKQAGDFMRGQGTHDPSLNPNSYPMTDAVTYPSAVRIMVQDEPAGTVDLPDDPADHQGILSWFSQKQDRHLNEAGSYGYLVTTLLPRSALERAEKEGRLTLRLEVDSSLPGGLAIYGSRFGRYPLDPTLVFLLK